MDTKASTVWINPERNTALTKLCAHFDGGKRDDDAAAYGWHLQGSAGMDTDGETEWVTLAHGSVLLDPSVSTVEAELQGLKEATLATVSWACRGTIELDGVSVKPQHPPSDVLR